MKSLATCALVCLLTGCISPASSTAAATATPAWVGSPFAHPALARGQFLAEVGVAPGTGGRARETARKRALEQINASIQVAVRSEIELSTRSLSVNGEVDWSEDLDESIRLTSSGELPGAEVLETWTDAEAHDSYVLVGVRRRLLLDELLPGVEQALAAADQHLTAPASEPVRRLTGLLSAHGLLTPAVALASRAHVIAQGSPDQRRTEVLFGNCSVALRDIHEELAALSSAMVIDKLAGDGQAGTLDGALAEPLVARFRFRRNDGALVPMVGLPVAFRAVDGPGTAIEQLASTTDAEGRITARVTSLAPTGKADSRLAVGADSARFSASLPLERLSHALFAYSMPTPAETKVLVVIEQTYRERRVGMQSLGHVLGDHLTEFGFDVEVLAPDSARGRELLTQSAPSVSASLADGVVILRGRARAWVSSAEYQTFAFRAAAEVDLLDRVSGQGRVIATDDGQARFITGDDGEGGAAGAFRALTPVLMAAVDRQFVSRYVRGVADDTP